MIIPWQVKFFAKQVLSSIPVNYGVWRRLALFRHGYMDDPVYAENVFARHFTRRADPSVAPETLLEIGPGDALVSALLGYSRGARAIHMVDVGNFATRDMKVYRKMLQHLNESNTAATLPINSVSVDNLMESVGGYYHTTGIASLAAIPDQSIDFLWSHTVLQHVRLNEVSELLQHTRRLLKNGGTASHRVDLRDMLSGALNQLRFDDRAWERDSIFQSGFYTNRMRLPDWINAFEMSGFEVELIHVDRFSTLPTPREKMALPFRNMPENDLLASGFDVVLRPIV